MNWGKIDWYKWIEENCVWSENVWYNGIAYTLATGKDGWVSIFERDLGRLIPCLQAADMDHVKSWCAMREPITVPMERIA